MQKPETKAPSSAQENQRVSDECNIDCTCGPVYCNPSYTLQWATCLRHGARDAVQSSPVAPEQAVEFVSAMRAELAEVRRRIAELEGLDKAE